MMLAWLKASLTSFCFYLIAPILFHASRDGLIMSSYYLLGDIIDAYGLFIIAFLIIGALTLYRNKLFNVFRTPTDRSRRASSSHNSTHVMGPRQFFTKIRTVLVTPYHVLIDLFKSWRN